MLYYCATNNYRLMRLHLFITIIIFACNDKPKIINAESNKQIKVTNENNCKEASPHNNELLFDYWYGASDRSCDSIQKKLIFENILTYSGNQLILIFNDDHYDFDYRFNIKCGNSELLSDIFIEPFSNLSWNGKEFKSFIQVLKAKYKTLESNENKIVFYDKVRTVTLLKVKRNIQKQIKYPRTQAEATELKRAEISQENILFNYPEKTCTNCDWSYEEPVLTNGMNKYFSLVPFETFLIRYTSLNNYLLEQKLIKLESQKKPKTDTTTLKIINGL